MTPRGPTPPADLAPLYAEVSGDGPPVMLLHGQPGTGGDWQWVAPILNLHFTVIVPDRPGYGLTGGPATGFEGNARAAVDLLDRLGCERAVLVAHSWAGGVALTAARRHPDRVAGLVLVASVGPVEKVGWVDRLLAAPVAGELIAALATGGAGLLVGSTKVQRLARSRLSGRARDGLLALSRLLADSGDCRPERHNSVWRSFVVEQRAMLAELNGLQAGLPGISAPTAILNGTADRLVPPEVGERLQQAIPGATRRLLPGAGHLLPHDQPVAVAGSVREVVARAGLSGQS